MKTKLLLSTLLALTTTGVAARDAAAECFARYGGGPTPDSCCWHEVAYDLDTPSGWPVVQAPAITSNNGGAAVDVFAQGGDNAIWTRNHNGTGWNSWVTLGGVLTSAPTAVSTGVSNLTVFARGNDGAVWYRERTGWTVGDSSWGTWKSMGGNIRGGVGAAVWADGTIEVSVIGTDNALWVATLSGGVSSGFTSKGGALSATPSLVHHAVPGGEAIEHWALAPGGQHWRRVHTRVTFTIGGHTTSTDTWSAWAPVAAGVTGVPAFAMLGPDGWVQIVRDAASRVYYRIFNSEGGSSTYYDGRLPVASASDLSATQDADDERAHIVYLDVDTRSVRYVSEDLTCSRCGDGTCVAGAGETCSSCPADCGPCEPPPEPCGNGVCRAGETCSSCPSDCSCPPPPPPTGEICGNFICGGSETCSSCPSDCGDTYAFCYYCPNGAGYNKTNTTARGCTATTAMTTAHAKRPNDSCSTDFGVCPASFSDEGAEGGAYGEYDAYDDEASYADDGAFGDGNVVIDLPVFDGRLW